MSATRRDRATVHQQAKPGDLFSNGNRDTLDRPAIGTLKFYCNVNGKRVAPPKYKVGGHGAARPNFFDHTIVSENVSIVNKMLWVYRDLTSAEILEGSNIYGAYYQYENALADLVPNGVEFYLADINGIAHLISNPDSMISIPLGKDIESLALGWEKILMALSLRDRRKWVREDAFRRFLTEAGIVGKTVGEFRVFLSQLLVCDALMRITDPDTQQNFVAFAPGYRR